jgi:hypothetical protein
MTEYQDSINALSNGYQSILDMVQTSHTTISNEISMASFILAAVALLFAIIGIFLGWYLNRLDKKTKDIRKEAEELLDEVSHMKKGIESINDQINNNLSRLYLRLREEESKNLLGRLVEEPLDILNISPLLLARNLSESFFPILKEAYSKLVNTNLSIDSIDKKIVQDKYYLLFFQHFLYSTIIDDDLRPYLSDFFSQGIECAFERDIIKSTNDLCRALFPKTVGFDKKTLLRNFLISLNNSKYKSYERIKNILENELDDSLLTDTIEEVRTQGIDLLLFKKS